MKIAKNILFWVLTGFLILIIALVAVPKLFGVEFRAVLTGSMEPEIPVGSLVVIVPAKAEDIRIGDDITFVNESERVVTHRVIRINLDNNEFITQGIANNAADPANRYENILGVVRFKAPVLGRVFSWISTTKGKIIAATVIVSAYIISSILSILLKGKKKDSKETPQNASEDLNESFVQADDLYGKFLESGELMDEEKKPESSHPEPEEINRDQINFEKKTMNDPSEPKDELLEKFLETGVLYEGETGDEKLFTGSIHELPEFLKDDELLAEIFKGDKRTL